MQGASWTPHSSFSIALYFTGDPAGCFSGGHGYEDDNDDNHNHNDHNDGKEEEEDDDDDEVEGDDEEDNLNGTGKCSSRICSFTLIARELGRKAAEVEAEE